MQLSILIEISLVIANLLNGLMAYAFLK